MTRDELIAVCRAMWGEEWQTPLADALRYDRRGVRRWASGERGVPARVEPVVRELAPKVAAELEARARFLREWAERGVDKGE